MEYFIAGLAVAAMLFFLERFVLWSATDEKLIQQIQSRYPISIVMIGSEMNKSVIVGGKDDGLTKSDVKLDCAIKMPECYIDTALDYIDDVVEENYVENKASVPDYPEDL